MKVSEARTMELLLAELFQQLAARSHALKCFRAAEGMVDNHLDNFQQQRQQV
jgi:hypothetical protein